MNTETVLYNKLKSHALANGFKLSPDTRLVKTLLKGMANNLKLYRRPYCPCRRRTGDIKKDKKIVCPCVYHKKEIKKWGHCYCGLFVKD